MKKFLILLIQGYRKTISPFLGTTCRFYPSCSRYAEKAIFSRGILAGVGLSIVRILKCNPFHPGGLDELDE